MELSKIKAYIGKSFFTVCTIISPKLNTQLRYRRVFKKKLDLNKPKTFNEKILWLKLNDYIKNPLVIKCADKYAVREYVTECGLEEILVPLIDVYDDATAINWKKLPESFVMKWNFGATMNVICPHKSRLDMQAITKKMNKWGKNKYWLPFSEMQYKYIDKKIVCEKFLDTPDGDLPDYKIYCFNGKPVYIMVCFDRTNNSESVHAKYVYFDTEWNIMPFSEYAINHENEIHFEKPEGMEYALKCAEILSKPFPFVRADFYILDGKVYFGELTFTPAGGLDTDLYSGDSIMGDLLKINI